MYIYTPAPTQGFSGPDCSSSSEPKRNSELRVESDRYGQATRQPRFQLFAESPTEFFLKAADAQVTFEKDASGKVSRMILHQNGMNVPGQKQ
jgi:hypothetical protein